MMIRRLAVFAFLLLAFVGPRKVAADEWAPIIEGIERREHSFYGSESIFGRFTWRETDHVLLSAEEELKLVGLMRESAYDEIRSSFPQCRVMRTPGYTYEFAKKGSRLYGKVRNPLVPIAGRDGETGAFDGSYGIEISQGGNSTISRAVPATVWPPFIYPQLLHMEVQKYVGFPEEKNFGDESYVPLPRVLREFPDLFSVQGVQAVDGAECVIVEAGGRYRLWLRVDADYLPVQWECYARDKGFEPASLEVRVTASDLRKVKPDLTLPFSIVQELYSAPKESGENKLKPKLEVVRQGVLEKLEFDALPDSFFDQPLPANGIVVDEIRGITYRNENGSVLFSEALKFALAKSGGQRFSLRTVLLIIGNLGAVVAILVLFYRHKSRSKAE